MPLLARILCYVLYWSERPFVTEWAFLSLGQDTRIRFSVDPFPGDPGYNQWKDAMKMVARLPEGVPTEFRKKVMDWLHNLWLGSFTLL